MQVDLLKLAKAIERLALANGGNYEQCVFVVNEGTAWVRQVSVACGADG